MTEEKREEGEFIPQTLSASPPPSRRSPSPPLLKSMESEDGVGEAGTEEDPSPVTTASTSSPSLASTSSSSPSPLSASTSSVSSPSLSASSPSLSSASPGSGEFRRRHEGGGSRIGGDRATTRIRDLLALTAVQDLVYLPSFSEETLMDTLKGRYHQGYIYTFAGSIMLAINPYQQMENIYSPHVARRYFGKTIGEMPSHIFSIAERAFDCLINTGLNQTLLVSGEEGAGKTESTNLMLQYLSLRTSESSNTSSQEKNTMINHNILAASPVLDSFGNATTLYNVNSSRFGKYTLIGFDSDSNITGANITPYLLEKSRLVQQAPGEKNYHIFYQMLAGASESEKKAWRLSGSFAYLGGEEVLPLSEQAKAFESLKWSMTFLGMSAELQDDIFRLASAVLNMGNIVVEEGECKDHHDSVAAISLESPALIASAELLGVEPAVLRDTLTMRSSVIKTEVLAIPLKPKEAEFLREGLAKFLYERLFNWLVGKINSILKIESRAYTIGLLDIFGFERYPGASLEQLCINYASEKLQNSYNQQILKEEQQEYINQKIPWSEIYFRDNKECVELFEKRPLGIFSLLDEECRFPQATDQTLLSKLHKHHENNTCYIIPKFGSNKSFIIKHFAGDVEYDVKDFLLKNKDSLPPESLTLISHSSFPLLKDLMDSEDDQALQRGRQKTVTSQFRGQLQTLVETIGATNVHYVRCIKPNMQQQPNNFDDEVVLRQLRSAGMLVTTRVRALGYPVRLEFVDFIRRYSFVAGKTWRDSTPEEILQSVEQHPGEASIERCNAIRLVNLLIENSTLSDGECRFGITKIFLRFRQADILEKERIRYLHASATKIQTIWRMSHQRRKFRRKQKAAISLQAFGKMVIARRCFQQLKAATIILQSVAKMIYARNQYQKVIRPGVVCIHAAARAKLARSFMLKMTWEKIDKARREAEINLTRERKVQKKRKKEEKVRSEKEKVQRELETRAFNNFQRRAEKEQHLAEKKVHEEVAQFVVPKDTPTNYLFDQSQIEEVSHLEALLSTPPQPFLAFPSSYQNVDYKDHLPQLSPSQTEGLLASTSTSSGPTSSTSGASSVSSSTSPSTQSRDIQTSTVTRSQNLPAPDVDETITESLTTAVSKEGAPRSSKTLPIMSLDTAAVRKATDLAFGRISSKSRSNPQLLDSKSSPRDNIPVKERRRLMPDTLSQLLSQPAPPILKDEEKTLYSFRDFANRHFQQHTVGLVRKRLLTIEEIVCHTTKPIKSSLLQLQSSDPNHVRMACEVFKHIMFYMGDRRPTTSRLNETTCVRTILHRGLAYKELRDEVFCQLCKQLTQNPSRDSKYKGWDLMAYCICTFPPTPRFSKYLAIFLQEAMCADSVKTSQRAVFCIEKLHRRLVNGERKMIPSDQELTAIRENKPIVIRIYFMNDTKKGIPIDSTTTAQEAIVSIANKIELTNFEGFALYQAFNDVEQTIPITDHLCDVIAKHEVLQHSLASKSVQVTLKFVFKKRLFFESLEPGPSTVEIEIALLYCQIVRDVLAGNVEATEQQLVELAGCQLQATFGDFVTARVVEDLLVPGRYLPARFLGFLNTSNKVVMDALKKKIEEYYSTLIGTNGKLEYLRRARQLSLFGATVFLVKVAKFSAWDKEREEMGSMLGGSSTHRGVGSTIGSQITARNNSLPLYLAINHKGISFHHITTFEELLSLSFSRITNWSAKRSAIPREEQMLILTDAQVDPLKITALQCTEISGILKDYASAASPNSNYALAVQTYDVTHPSLLRFKEGDIITILEKDSSGWYFGECNGQVGLFPVDHVELIAYNPSTSDSAKRLTRTTSSLKGKPKKKSEQDNQVVVFTKDPISIPLLVPEGSPSENIAKKTFKWIMTYMGDYPNTKGKHTFEQLAVKIVAQALTSPLLKDEVYYQLIKQTTQNPNPISNSKGWELLVLSSTCFRPSADFEDTLYKHLSTHNFALDFDSGSFITKALRRLKVNGDRRCPPAIEEMRKVLEGSPLVFHVALQSGTTKGLIIDAATTVKEVMTNVVKRIDLKGNDFGLFEVNSLQGVDRPLSDTDKICDIKSSWGGAQGLSIALKKKHFFQPRIYNEDEILSDSTGFNIEFHQIKNDFLRGRIPVSQSEAIYLAALLVHIQAHDNNSQTKEKGAAATSSSSMTSSSSTSPGTIAVRRDVAVLSIASLDKFIPQYLVPLQRAENWIEAIHQMRNEKMTEVTEEGAKLQFLKTSRQLPLFGSHVWPVTYVTRQGDTENRQHVWFAISSKGVRFLAPFSRELICYYSYGQISSWLMTPDSEGFTVIAGSLMKPLRHTFFGAHSSDMFELFKFYRKHYSDMNEDLELTANEHVAQATDIFTRDLRVTTEEGKTVLIGGSFRKIVYWLTCECEDPEDRRALFMTYRAFAAPERLLRILFDLQKSYCTSSAFGSSSSVSTLQPDSNEGDLLLTTSASNLELQRAKVKTKIVRFLREWLEQCFEFDFKKKPLLKEVLNFVNRAFPEDANHFKLLMIKLDGLDKVKNKLGPPAIDRRPGVRASKRLSGMYNLGSVPSSLNSPKKGTSALKILMTSSPALTPGTSGSLPSVATSSSVLPPIPGSSPGSCSPTPTAFGYHAAALVSASKSAIPLITLEQLDPDLVVECLTKIEWELYKSINPPELTAQQWSKGTSTSMRVNLTNLARRFNTVSYWVATEIIRAPGMGTKISLVEKFILIADRCLGINSFNTLMAIISGLNNSAIRRLKKIWSGISEKARELFQHLEEVMSLEANFKRYRDLLSSLKTGPAIPYMAVALRDMVFIGDGNPDFLEIEEGVLNFNKLRLVGSLFGKLQSIKSPPYSFRSNMDLAIENYLQNLNFMDEDELYEHSLMNEPLISPRAPNFGLTLTAMNLPNTNNDLST